MKFKKFVLKHRYLFLFFLVVSIPLVILADFSLDEAYQILPGDVNKKIYQRQSDNIAVSSKAVCIDASDSAHSYFVGNKTKGEIESFFTSYYNDPSRFNGVTIKTGCCVDGICDGSSGENCDTCWDDCQAQCPVPCAGSIVDSRDGQSYPIIGISDQCWMAKNMNIGTMISASAPQLNDSSIQKYCYADSSSYCYMYGGLYQWDEAMQYSEAEKASGICPSGWHIPSEEEYETLSNNLGGNSVAGGKLKSTSTYWTAPNIGATNYSGFSALPGGGLVDFSFNDLGSVFGAWTSNINGSDMANTVDLQNNQAILYFGATYKTEAYSIRCIRNQKATLSNYTLTYVAGANGSITGSTSQTVISGGSGAQVTAVPSAGYRFSNWSDGLNTNPRTDAPVNGNINVTANFVRICPLSFTDSRDGNTYLTEYIAGRCWMRENLRYLPTIQYSSDSSSSAARYYVYDYTPTWFNPPKVSDAKENPNYGYFGVLYNWTAASTACPSGWSLPSNGSVYLNEGYNLAALAGTDYTHLKITMTPYIAPLTWKGSGVSGAGDDSTLFSARPGGQYTGAVDVDYRFQQKGYNMWFWASTQCKTTTLCGKDDPNKHLAFTNGSSSFTQFSDNFRGFSVRCVKSY
jgi:uncharacterized protein (TIGR02145 family)